MSLDDDDESSLGVPEEEGAAEFGPDFNINFGFSF